MSHKDFANVPLMRKPKPGSGKSLNQLKRIIEEKYHISLGDRHDLHQWSVEHIAEFWAEFWDFTGIIHSKKYDQVIDLKTPMKNCPEWFQGARLNMAENLLRYKDDRVALISAGEDKESENITFAQMNEKVKLYAAAFRRCSIQTSDVVACYISNRAEAVFAMQATISIGAIWTGAIPLLGSQAVLNRLKQVKPKILLTIDRFKNNKEEIEMLCKVKEIVDALPSLKKVIIVPSKPESKLKDISAIRNSCFLDEFLELGRNADGTVPPIIFQQVSFSHPVYISFTSGTTGLPKAMFHGFGALLGTSTAFWMQMDSDRDSIWFSMSPVGWVSWNMAVALTFGGIALMLYEGVPYYLTPSHIWDLVDEFGITHLFLAANVLSDLENLGYEPTEKNHLKTLQVIIAGGSVVKVQCYDFVYQKIRKDVIFSSNYGCTELMSMALVMDPTIAIYKGEMSVKCLGVDLQCINEAEMPVEGEMGELVIAKPCPFLPLSLLNDPDTALYKKTYFSKFQDKFNLKDYAVVNPVTKGFTICGRSDDTLKQRGTRFGSSEMYNIVEMFPEIQDSLCVAQYNKSMDERAVLFLKMREGHEFNEKLVKQIQKKIANELTSHHIPEIITKIQDIPYNVNGKKMETIVKSIINNKPFNSDSVINPECLMNFQNLPELQGF